MAVHRIASLALRNFRHISSPQTKITSPLSCRHLIYQQHRRLVAPSKEASTDDVSKDGKPPRRAGFLARLLGLDGSGESLFLRMLGYYSVESKAIGAANSLYGQILQRANSALSAEFSDAQRSAFVPQYEMLALHIYITLHRLRFEKGSVYEKDATIAMQTLFENFWNDVRTRMMMEEHKLTLLQSAKWIKQCEKNFFSMALDFDEAWGNEDKFRERITKHITSLNSDPKKSSRFLHYMQRERARLNKMSIAQIWGGECWDPSYPFLAR